MLQKDATFEGPIVLPPKAGADYIYIETEGFLTPGRLSPSGTPLAKIFAGPSYPAVIAGPGAHHFRFVGVDCHSPNQAIDTLVLLGDSESPDLAAQSHHIILDRCWVHGDPALGGKRGVSLQGQWQAVIDSHVADWKGNGFDTQAICGWNGAGPFKITNSFLEGAGENVMFGGADAQVPNLTPSDIEIRGNHFFKPPKWRGVWLVKNLLELKHSQRVLIQDNLMENCWADGQVGFAVLFTVRNQSGGNPWATVSDVTFVENAIHNAANGINMLGNDNESGVPSQPARRLLVAQNLMKGIGAFKGTGTLFQILSGYEDVTINHNTAMQTGSIIVADGAPCPRFKFINNIAPHNLYGIFGSGYGVGNPAITHYFPGSTIVKNVMQGGDPAIYPPDNYFPATMEEVGFVSYPEDLHLTPSSPYAGKATDGTDIGY